MQKEQRMHHCLQGVCKHQEKTPGARREDKSLGARGCASQEQWMKQRQMGRVSMNVNGNYIHFCTGQRYVSSCGATDNYVTLTKNPWAVDKKLRQGL